MGRKSLQAFYRESGELEKLGCFCGGGKGGEGGLKFKGALRGGEKGGIGEGGGKGIDCEKNSNNKNS
jgi:hypothetical protein